MIKLKINSAIDRNALISILANNGYAVKVETENIGRNVVTELLDYYVVILDEGTGYWGCDKHPYFSGWIAKGEGCLICKGLKSEENKTGGTTRW